MKDNFVVENKDIKTVGDWLWHLLSPVELSKILQNKHAVIEPSSKVVLNIQITLWELEQLHDFGHLPESRNCFEIRGKRK
jgi:hypothetical protein